MKIASRIMMWIAGLLFLAAGGLKVYQLLTEPENPDAYIVDTWLFGVIQTPLELGLGIWLISGLFKKAGWLIAQVGYGVFICITIWRFATGQESCGCFGNIHVAPEITLFAIDIPMFIGLAVFHPRKEKLLPPPWPNAVHFICVAIPTAILLSALVPTLVFNRPVAEVITAGSIVTQKPKITFKPDAKITPAQEITPEEVKPEQTITEPESNNAENTVTPVPEEVTEPKVPTAQEKVTDPQPENNAAQDEQQKPTEVVEPAISPEPEIPAIPDEVVDEAANPVTQNDAQEPEEITEPDQTTAQAASQDENNEDNEPTKNIKPQEGEWDVIAKTDMADTLRSGIKIILLFREDCDVCHEAMPMFEEYAEQFGDDEDSIRIAFVELPPYSEEHELISEDTKCLVGKYISDKKVYGSTPIIVITVGGVPLKAWDGKDPIPTFDDLMAAMME